MMIRLLRKTLSLLGYDSQIVKKKYYSDHANRNFGYSMIKSTSAYSPWLEDKEFIEVYQVIKEHTLVDIYRCYELWSLIGEANKLTEKGAYLEVGVWKGGTSALIGKKLKILGADEILYSADTFRGVVKSTKNDSSYNDGEHNDTNSSLVEELFYRNLNLSNIKILKGIFPEETQHLIPANTKFKFCHIDVDVYQSSKDIVTWIWDRLVIGGIILFDDYGFITCDGITKFVNEQKHKKDNLFIYNLNGHGILMKIR